MPYWPKFNPHPKWLGSFFCYLTLCQNVLRYGASSMYLLHVTEAYGVLWLPGLELISILQGMIEVTLQGEFVPIRNCSATHSSVETLQSIRSCKAIAMS